MKTPEMIQVDKLKAFENHPYKVEENEEMEMLTQSIKVSIICLMISIACSSIAKASITATLSVKYCSSMNLWLLYTNVFTNSRVYNNF